MAKSVWGALVGREAAGWRHWGLLLSSPVAAGPPPGDTAQVRAWREQAQAQLRAGHFAEALPLLQQSRELARQLHFVTGEVLALRTLGRSELVHGSFDKARAYLEQGVALARRGPAQWVTGRGKSPRFYWYGTWTSYEADGQISAVQTYINGSLTRAETYEKGQLTQAEVFEHDKRSRVETYSNGQLIKVESFEKGLRVGTTSTL